VTHCAQQYLVIGHGIDIHNPEAVCLIEHEQIDIPERVAGQERIDHTHARFQAARKFPDQRNQLAASQILHRLEKHGSRVSCRGSRSFRRPQRRLASRTLTRFGSKEQTGDFFQSAPQRFLRALNSLSVCRAIVFVLIHTG
jgi:hypothetical protein